MVSIFTFQNHLFDGLFAMPSVLWLSSTYLFQTSPNITPPEIYLINFVNEIYHEVNRSDNEKLKGKVAAICNTFLLNERLRRK